MARTFRTCIISPESCEFDGEVESLVVPGICGYFGILARHAPMIAAVRVGILRARKEGETLLFVVGNGALEVGGNMVTVVADSALQATGEGDAEEKLEVMLEAGKTAI